MVTYRIVKYTDHCLEVVKIGAIGKSCSQDSVPQNSRCQEEAFRIESLPYEQNVNGLRIIHASVCCMTVCNYEGLNRWKNLLVIHHPQSREKASELKFREWGLGLNCLIRFFFKDKAWQEESNTEDGQGSIIFIDGSYKMCNG